MYMGKMIAWIKIHQCIWLTWAQRNGGGSVFDLLLMWPSIILTKHQQSHLNLGEYKLDTLGFHRAIVNVYYHLHRKNLLSTTLFTSIRSLYHPKKNLPFAGINHWIAKDSQWRCSLPGYKGTSVYYCKKYNVRPHAKCFDTVSTVVCKVYVR